MNIILCGLPMSGKSSIGKKLSKKLGLFFIDIDQEIEKEYQRLTKTAYTCRQIFMNEGEEFFRLLEKKQIALLLGITNSVVALGGGGLKDQDNIDVLEKVGIIVYLKATPEILWPRVEKRGLPAYVHREDPQKAFYALAKERLPSYEAAANVTIDTNHLTEKEVINCIVNHRRILHGK